jgi:integrase
MQTAVLSQRGDFLVGARGCAPPTPCQRLTDLNRWHKSKARTGRLTEKQFPAFFAALEQADNPIFADDMELLVRAALRRAEAACLRWSDLNMTAKTVTIPAERAKNGQALTLPKSPRIETLFQRRREAVSESMRVFGNSSSLYNNERIKRLVVMQQRLFQ